VPTPSPNPRRVAAGRRNHARRVGLTPAGMEALRAAALAGKPWEHSSGPRTAAGKAKSAANGTSKQQGDVSVRAARREAAEVMALVAGMAALRTRLLGDRPGAA
jgi:hypothetical protein